MKIGNSINKAIGNTLNKGASTNFVTGALKKALQNPPKYAGTMLIATIVSKDIVNGFLYTYQSWNNKKIPENKRKFVAALDAMNCIFMVGGQLGIGYLIDKGLTPWLQKKYNGYSEDPITKVTTPVKHSKSPLAYDNVHKLAENSLKNYVDDVAKYDTKALSKEVINGLSGKYKSMATGISIIVTALATTALVKRTITPLITTPLAGWLKDKYLDKPKVGAKKVEPKSDKKPKEAPNLDDKLLDHSTAPWNYSNQPADKATFKKISAK